MNEHRGRRAYEQHGRSHTATYAVWCNMLQRCNNPRAWNYKHYGARGIEVCERWDFFSAFLQDMGERPDGCELDRIDRERGYEPGNCRWTPRKENRAASGRRRRQAKCPDCGCFVGASSYAGCTHCYTREAAATAHHSPLKSDSADYCPLCQGFGWVDHPDDECQVCNGCGVYVAGSN